MQGSANPLIQLLYHSGRQYIVPVYQRPYSWSVKQCAQLFDDLEGMLRNDRPSHFFGSVVLKYNQCGDFTECVVIDGQQRLTTVSLLLLTLRDLSRNTRSSTSSNPLRRPRVCDLVPTINPLG